MSEKEQIEKDKIYNCDCLEGMKHIPNASIDAIICDLPYGTMKGVLWKGDRTVMNWDEQIPTDQLFAEYSRVLRKNGVAVLFSQEPYTSHLRTYTKSWLEFLYPMIWLKESSGSGLIASTAPLSYFEDINVFKRSHDIDENKTHPLRNYAQQLISFIGKPCSEVMDDFRRWNIDTPTRVAHFLQYDALQFRLCTAETYDILIQKYGIDKMPGYREYESLRAERDAYNAKFQKVFNLPEGKVSRSNVLQYNKDMDGFHPTQKPVALIADLIRTYSNEGDTILDNCMGSGTTAVACIKEKRHFIGFELNKDYYDKACRRIDAERRQLSLF